MPPIPKPFPLGATEAEQIAYFEQLGANQVRMLIDDGGPEVPLRPTADIPQHPTNVR